jgi:hypothetical protein
VARHVQPEGKKVPSAQSGKPREPEVFEQIKNLRVSKWLDAENVPNIVVKHNADSKVIDAFNGQ